MIDHNPIIQELRNGLRVVSLTLPGHQTASVVIAWRTGNRAEQGDEAGFAHLAEHLLFPDDPDDLSAFDAMGGQINAWSGHEYTLFYAHVPMEYLYNVLHRLTRRLGSAIRNLSEEAFDRELQAVRNELFSEGESILELALARCQGKPRMSPGGISRTATLENLKKFISRELHSQSLCVGVAAGFLDHNKVLKACSPLADLPTGAKKQTYSLHNWHEGLYENFEGANSPGALWMMPIQTCDSQASQGITLGERALCSGLDAPVFRELRKQGLAYGIQATHEAWDDGGYWALQIVGSSTELPATLPTVNAAITSAIENLSTKDLDSAWSSLNSSSILENDDTTILAMKLSVDGLFGRIIKPSAPPPRLPLDTVRTTMMDSWLQRSCFVTGKRHPYSIHANRQIPA